MTTDLDLVKLAPVPPADTSKWHVLDPDELLTTACSRPISTDEVRERSPEGDTPSTLSGRTVCYDCVRDWGADR